MVPPIRRRDEFAALSRSPARGRSGPVWVARIDGHEDGAEPVRVAYAVPRAVGGAVVRNRVRRRLRAVIAEVAAEAGLAPGAYLVGARPGTDRLTFPDVRRHLHAALRDASRDRGPE